MRGLAISLFAFASSLFASALVSASVVQASVSISAACTPNVTTFAITGLTWSENFTMSVSQNGSSDWTNLGVAPAPAESMIIPVPMEGNEGLASITSYNSATYRVHLEIRLSRLLCHNIHYATKISINSVKLVNNAQIDEIKQYCSILSEY